MSDETSLDPSEGMVTEDSRSSEYSLRVGGGISGQVVVGNHNVLINAAAGSSVTVRSGEQPALQPRSRPVGRPLPRRGPAPLGRDGELTQIVQAIQDGRPVHIFGMSGVGKSTLLREVAARRMADGQDVVYLSAAGLPTEDIVQELFQTCYCVDDYRPEPERLRWLMGSIRALIVVDDFEGPTEDLSELLDVAPACDFLVASIERCLKAGDGLTLSVGGLAEKPALAMLTAQTGRPLGQEELRSAKELWQAAQGHPLALLQAWSALGAASTPCKTTIVGVDWRVLAAAITPRLTMSARQLLAALCAIPELPVSAELLTALSETAAEGPALAELLEAQLAESGPNGYRARGELAILVTQQSGIEVTAAELAGRFVSWAQSNATVQAVTNATPIVLHLLRAAIAGGHDAAVRDLARLTAPVLARTLRWGSWRKVLALGGQAAHRLGSAVDEAYFAHEERILKRVLFKGVAAGAVLSGAMAGGKLLAEPKAFAMADSVGSGTSAVAGSGTSLSELAGVKAILAKSGLVSVATKPALIAVGGAVCAAVVVGTTAAIALGRSEDPPTTFGAQTLPTATSTTSTTIAAAGEAFVGTAMPTTDSAQTSTPAAFATSSAPKQTVAAPAPAPSANPVTTTNLGSNPGPTPTWNPTISSAPTTVTTTKSPSSTVTTTTPPTPTTTAKNLAAPEHVSPADGSVLTNYPRDTTLTWKAVTGAARYYVEVECLHCRTVGQWSPWTNTTTTATSYSFTWVGDNDGRWRITAIAADGTRGATSGWWRFTYNTRPS